MGYQQEIPSRKMIEVLTEYADSASDAWEIIKSIKI